MHKLELFTLSDGQDTECHMFSVLLVPAGEIQGEISMASQKYDDNN